MVQAPAAGAASSLEAYVLSSELETADLLSGAQQVSASEGDAAEGKSWRREARAWRGGPVKALGSRVPFANRCLSDEKRREQVALQQVKILDVPMPQRWEKKRAGRAVAAARYPAVTVTRRLKIPDVPMPQR